MCCSPWGRKESDTTEQQHEVPEKQELLPRLQEFSTSAGGMNAYSPAVHTQGCIDQHRSQQEGPPGRAQGVCGGRSLGQWTGEDSWPPPPAPLPGAGPVPTLGGQSLEGTYWQCCGPHIRVLGWGQRCNTQLPTNHSLPPTIKPQMEESEVTPSGLQGHVGFPAPCSLRPTLCCFSSSQGPQPMEAASALTSEDTCLPTGPSPPCSNQPPPHWS